MIIYKATNILNNKCYIGASKYSLEQRKQQPVKDGNFITINHDNTVPSLEGNFFEGVTTSRKT